MDPCKNLPLMSLELTVDHWSLNRSRMGIGESRSIDLRRMLQCTSKSGPAYFSSEASSTFVLESNFASGTYA